MTGLLVSSKVKGKEGKEEGSSCEKGKGCWVPGEGGQLGELVHRFRVRF